MLYKGKLYLSLEQLDALTAFLGEDLGTLLAGNREYYEKKIVHCMTPFSSRGHASKPISFQTLTDQSHIDRCQGNGIVRYLEEPLGMRELCQCRSALL